MTASPAPPRMLGLNALTTCDMLCSLIAEVDRMAKEGRELDAAAAMHVVVSSAAAIRPMIGEVILAQRQAAQALDFAHRPTVRVLASIGVAHPHPHAANSEAQSPSPEQPSPSVA